MKYNVYMLAFMEGQIREVNVPDEVVAECARIDTEDKIGPNVPTILDKIYYYGQNDFQPVKDRCSVSMCDVIEFNNQMWLVDGCGFKQLSPEQFEEYKNTTRLERIYYIQKLFNNRVD